MTSLSYASPAATLPQPETTWQYVYGIISSEDQLLFEVSGVADAAEVYTVCENGLAVITSAIARPHLGGLERADVIRHLTAHQRVLEAVQQDFPVLPIKFGTIFPDEERLRALLRCGAGVFNQALATFAGKQQMEVVVLWDLGRVFEQIASDEAIVALKASIANRPAEATIDERIAVGQLVQKALMQQRARLSQDLIAQLRDVADDLVINPLMNDAMIANIALLVSDERRAELDERLDALDAQYEGLQIRCVGPLPPYSFATIEAQAPSFELVDAARQAINIDEWTTYAELKRSFRALAARHHPDHNQNDPDAAALMDSLTGAYRLLSAVALAQGAGSGGECRFDRASVEQSVLLAIVRQEGETAPEGARS